jgi:hypothetical protein
MKYKEYRPENMHETFWEHVTQLADLHSEIYVLKASNKHLSGKVGEFKAQLEEDLTIIRRQQEEIEKLLVENTEIPELREQVEVQARSAEYWKEFARPKGLFEEHEYSQEVEIEVIPRKRARSPSL